MLNVVKGVGCFVVLFLVFSCASRAPGLLEVEASLPAGLEERLALYWQAWAEKDWRKAWELEAPLVHEKLREEQYRSYFLAINKARLLGVKVLGMRCKGAICWVKFEVTHEVEGGKKDVRVFEDRWLHEGGQWYHFLYEPLFFPQLIESKTK